MVFDMNLGNIIGGITVAMFTCISGFSQEILSPEEFLGYPLGSTFTFHHRMIDYYEYVAEQSPKVQLISYGKTYEDRPLVVAALSSEKNMAQLEDIRQANLFAAGLSQIPPQKAAQLPIVWYGFNVHGNEAAAMEASIAMLYALMTQDTLNWLDDMVVLIDPCINPDGRDRYASWYRQAANSLSTPNGNSYEHNEPWPRGRYNHYLFDLNRDWAWQSQQESKSRTALYRRWMPHVAVDFHEMGANSPFFFGPAAKPLHEVISPWQRTFQRLVGRGNARYFDERGWLYFTHEVYDLLYPSYGDTWPTYNGAIGFTYEQGGSGSAGTAYIIASGDTLFLTDRIAHHFIAGWATLETTHQQSVRLLKEFNSYFQKGRESPTDPYKSYVVSARENSPERLRAFCKLLDAQGIQYAHPKGTKGSYQGFSYQSGERESFEVDKSDILISSYQSKSRLVQVLMEPETYLEDSITYDLTAWALPYVYDLVAYATEDRLETRDGEFVLPNNRPKTSVLNPYAWLLKWEDFQSARFLSAILKEKIRVRYAEKAFSMGKETFAPGTLIITRSDNPFSREQKRLLDLAAQFEVSLYPVASGKVDEGIDFGSRNVSYLNPPRIALINGEGVSATAFGELWHYFEQDLSYPIEVVNTQYLGTVDLTVYDKIILPAGNYYKFSDDLISFVEVGGTVCAMERAISFATRFSEEEILTKLGEELLRKEEQKEAEGEIELGQLDRYAYDSRERERLKNRVVGSIFEVSIDTSHPLGYGMTDRAFLLKRNSTVYPFLPKGEWNVGTFEGDAHRSGFTGSKLRKELQNTLAFGQESLGEGNIIYFVDSPIIRQFWYSGKMLLGNAVFFGE